MPSSAPPALELQGVCCTFTNADDPAQRYTAVAGVSLSVGAGEFVSVVGPTGCGKSTLLNVGAGLLQPTTGSVRVFGLPLVGINRRAGCMFQTESLMPWRTALGNVMAGLEFRGALWATGGRRAAPSPPNVPMGGSRAAAWGQQNKRAVLFITHDLDEAIAMSDRVVVLSAGPAARPIGEFKVDLARPRDVAEVRSSPRFIELHQAIWAVLRDEVLKGYAQQLQKA